MLGFCPSVSKILRKILPIDVRNWAGLLDREEKNSKRTFWNLVPGNFPPPTLISFMLTMNVPEKAGLFLKLQLPESDIKIPKR